MLQYILIYSLVLTLALELCVAAVWRVCDLKGMALVAAVNILTNPSAVTMSYLIANAVTCNKYVIQLTIETTVIVVEWLLYKKFDKSITSPFLFSLSSNVFSYVTGVILNILTDLL